MDNQLLEKRIAELSPLYRDFVESGFVENAAVLFADSENLSGRNVDVLENAFFFYLLSLLNEQETATFIGTECRLPQSKAENLLFAFTTSLPKDLNEHIKNEYIKLHQETAVAPSLTLEIAETERAFEELHHIRTMAHDMNEARVHPITPQMMPEVTHRSSQDDILSNPQATLKTNPSTPRWDTEV